MSHVFHRSAKTVPPMARSGRGIHIYDYQGNAYIDACGGAAVSCLGHSDAEVNAAIRAQSQKLAYAHTSFFTSEPAEALADLLIAQAPEGLERVYFLCDGSEAVETALKLAHQYHRECGEPERTYIIARSQSYHGNTLGALSAGGNAWRRATYEAILLPSVSHIDPCWDYRYRADGETPQEYGLRSAQLLEAEILRIGPEKVSCFIAETVSGATIGCVPPAPGYFKQIREICDRYGILLILDEVMCGMGRTGTLHACEQEGISPDILVIAKGLGAGYIPLGAVLCTARIHAAFAAGSGAFMHGHTFVGHPVACASALAVQRAISGRGLIERVRSQGANLRACLESTFSDHSNIGDIRGRGLFMAIELVEDRDLKTPFDPQRRIHAKIRDAAMDQGLLVYAMGGTLDGRQGDHIILAPPYIASELDIEEIVIRLDTAVERAIDMR